MTQQELVDGVGPGASRPARAPLARAGARWRSATTASTARRKSVRVGGVVEQPGLQVPDHVGRARRPRCHDRYAAGGRLAQRVAAGLVLAGVDQHVEGRQRDGQVAGLAAGR